MANSAASASTSTPRDGAVDVVQPRAVIVAAIGHGLDGFDLLALSFALTGIIATFGVSDVRAGALATVTLLGAVTGGITCGFLGDRYGRMKVLTWTVAVFGVATGLTSLATGYWDLSVYRFVAGVGIGGEFGIGMTVAAEAVSARWRARATSWVAAGFQVGVLAAALVATPVIDAFGWRGMFAVGAFPAVVAVIARSRVPESSAFLASRAAADAPSAADTVKSFFGDRVAARITLALVVLTAVQNIGYFGLMTWLPHYLSVELGLGLGRGSLWTAVTVLGMLTGILIFGQLSDRIGRRHTFWLYQVGAASSVFVYSRLTDPTALMIGGFVMGAFVNGMLGGLGALIADLYPTRARATAHSVLFNVGRAIGGLAPIGIASLAAAHGFGFALAALAGLYGLQFVTMFALPERRFASA